MHRISMPKQGIIRDIQRKVMIPRDMHLYLKELAHDTGISESQLLFDIISNAYVGKKMESDSVAIACNKAMSNVLDEIIVSGGNKNLSSIAVSALTLRMFRDNTSRRPLINLPDIGLKNADDSCDINDINATTNNGLIDESLKYEVDYIDDITEFQSSTTNNMVNNIVIKLDENNKITTTIFNKCCETYTNDLLYGENTSYNSSVKRQLKTTRRYKGIYDYCCFNNNCDDHFLAAREIIKEIDVEADPIETILLYLLTCSGSVDPHTSYAFYIDTRNDLHVWLRNGGRKFNIYEKVNAIFNCWLSGIFMLPPMNTPCFVYLYYTIMNHGNELFHHNSNIMNYIDESIPIRCIQNIVFRIIMTKFNKEVEEIFDKECVDYLIENGIIQNL